MNRTSRAARAVACLLAFSGILTAPAFALQSSSLDAQSALQARAVALLNGQPCAVTAARAQAQAELQQSTPTPSPTPSASATPGIPPAPTGPGTLFATPYPTSSPVTPPPVPTPTPAATGTHGPVFIIQPSGAPSISPVSPAGRAPLPSPSANGPSPLPTLQPGYVAVVADKVVGNTNDGKPADLYGHVSIFYSDEELVGDHAHWDGHQFLTVSGNPYIIDRNQDSILYADTVVFDSLTQHATLADGHGKSSQGVEKGLVYYSAKNLNSDASGVAHGTNASLTTCERSRSGYHVTGKTMDVDPGDKITIYKAVLWLGAAAVFYLPKVVIPLRSVDDQRRRPQFFPLVGYDQAEGYWVKSQLGFGQDQYYYGYYRVEFFSKVGLGLGYVGSFTAKSGRRSGNINYYGIHDKRTQTSTYNLQTQETENFSHALRNNLNFSYVSNFGPIDDAPPNTNINDTFQHTGQRESQTYTFARTAVGSQSSTENLGFTDTRSLAGTLQNTVAFTTTESTTNTSFFNGTGGFTPTSSFISSSHVNDLVHWSNSAADYQLTFDKTFQQNPNGLIDKLPELQVRPYSFLRHFIFPVSSTLTIGDYSEEQDRVSAQTFTPFNTQRADMNFVFGPGLYHVLGSDLSATVTVNQYAYGTGDLKATIQQALTLSTNAGQHFANSISYNEFNANGPALVPFQNLDLLEQPRSHTINDTLHFFNEDIYNLALNFGYDFNTRIQGPDGNDEAPPITYQLTVRPSNRSYVTLAGDYVANQPGPQQGFGTTTTQFSTPFGRDADLQFVGNIDWKAHGRIENKTVYYHRIIGDCYEFRVSYNQSQKLVNFTIDILAFPSHTGNFGLNTQGGPLVPTGLNF